MALYLSPIPFIAYFIQYAMWFIFFSRTLEPRYDKRFSLTVIPLLYLPYYALWVSWPHGTVIHSYLPPLVIFLYVCILFSDRIALKLLSFFAARLPISLAEILFSALVMKPGVLTSGVMGTYSTPQQIGLYALYLCFQALLLVFMLFMWYRHNLREARLLNGMTWLVFLFFPCSQYILMLHWFMHLRVASDPVELAIIVTTVVLCIIADTALIIIIIGEMERFDLVRKNDALKKLIDLQDEYYPALSEHYEYMRRMRHDIANHMYTISALLERSEVDSAREYADELARSNSKAYEFGICPNPVVASFLYYRRRLLNERGIEVSLDIRLPEKCSIQNTELITAFGNLIDNAEEACESCEEKYIHISCSRTGSYLRISTENPIPVSGQPKQRRIDTLERGLGTKILSKLAEKYDGHFSISPKDGVFTAELILKEGTPHD